MLAVLQKCKSALVVNSTSFTTRELRKAIIYHGVMDLPDTTRDVCEVLQAAGRKVAFISATRALSLDTCVMSFFCSRFGNRAWSGHLSKEKKIKNCVFQNCVSVFYHMS